MFSRGTSHRLVLRGLIFPSVQFLARVVDGNRWLCMLFCLNLCDRYCSDYLQVSKVAGTGEAPNKVLLCGPGGFNDGITKMCEQRGYGTEETKDLFHVF